MLIHLHIAIDGTTIWFYKFNRHNKYAPAVKYTTGTKAWYVNGKKHRLDGPAVEFADSRKEYWYVDDFECNSYLEYLVAIEEYKLDKENV